MSRSTRSGLSQESVGQFLATLKQEPRNRLISGYDALIDLSPAQRTDLVQYVIRTPNPHMYGFDPSSKSFASTLGEDRTSYAASALRLLILAVLGSTSPVVLEKFTQAGVISPKAQPVVRELLPQIDADREQISSVLQGADVATELLPSLETFEIGLDVRLGFGDKALMSAVPIAVVHIDTSEVNRELWFQMSREQVEAMVKDLQQLLERFAIAEQASTKFLRR